MFFQVSGLQHNIEQAGSELMTIICDGNRTNQAFFKRYDTVQDQPWKSTGDTYLLYDLFHLWKIVQKYLADGASRRAHVRSRLDHKNSDMESTERSSRVLTKTSVWPKPIEPQRVSTCLQVSDEKTVCAIRHHPHLEKSQGTEDTDFFI